MKHFCQKVSLMVMLLVFGMSGMQLALAQGNSANTPGHDGSGPGKSIMVPGKNRNLGHGNASNGIKAIIKANRQIFYTGDLLEIGVRFPRGAELVQSGEVDAFLMIFEPDATLGALPSSQSLDIDDDGDGFVDDDTTGDGFVDDDDDVEDDDNSEGDVSEDDEAEDDTTDDNTIDDNA